MMKKYKALFLDWDDTIGDFKNAAFRSLQEIYAKHHLEAMGYSFEAFYETYSQHNLYLWEQYGLDKVTKDYLEHDRFFYPLMMAPKPLPMKEASELAQIVGKEHLNHTTDYFAPLPGAIDFVRALAEKYPLTIVSNGFVEVQYKKIEASGLRNCFAHIILSEEVGCQKPNPKIYEEALRQNGLKADDVLMIGDSWTSDIQGAINAGIDQLWVSPAAEADEHPATYKVSCLADALALLM